MPWNGSFSSVCWSCCWAAFSCASSEWQNWLCFKQCISPSSEPSTASVNAQLLKEFTITSLSKSFHTVNLAPFTRDKPKANESLSQSIESTECNYVFIVFLEFIRLHRVCKELLWTPRGKLFFSRQILCATIGSKLCHSRSCKSYLASLKKNTPRSCP